MKQEPDSMGKLVVIIKFIFSILTCRSKTEWIGALIGIISTTFSRSMKRTNICIVETSWKTDICIVEKHCPWPNWESVLVCLLVCMCICVLMRVYLLTFIHFLAVMKNKGAFHMAIILEPEGWVLKQAMME